MSTLRYSGEIRIRVTYQEWRYEGGFFADGTPRNRNGRYRCYLRDARGVTTVVIVGAPEFLSHAVDSPEAFDEAAHAAISFADDNNEEREERLSCYHWANIAAYKVDGSGWHIGRSEARAWPEEPTPRIHIGDVMVHRGEPKDGNPYHGQSLCGPERKEALRAFKEGAAPASCTYWYAPASGGARRVEANEVDWESSGV